MDIGGFTFEGRTPQGNMNKLKQRGTDLNLNTYGMYGVGGAGKRA